ncbi:hypothetical protein GOFOIKOB_6614 [Methylobacterium tardum]|uniref:Uncharacterized protein n=1 Tax=Methylobacterium tardum TaxID=374432 RepID=A0AA37TEN9_9HYPH|nr:hypothetical protein [Methylobacterium tardum]URD35204.1 hypothetical protein M6G65_22120 [Methylobacterium tardum]GJE53530.1 hypothetical protein GOFOIKOB_6614 [Methylobacterium tardum]GLS70395.1 hypothetical protein GCM10007890_24080 [Methylobacterium tardum]
MSNEADPVLEAVAALRALGYTVVPDEDFERWQVDGGEWITLGDLLALALRLGLMDSTTTKLQ